jgi:Gpi18-like mannosyltransferase
MVETNKLNRYLIGCSLILFSIALRVFFLYIPSYDVQLDATRIYDVFIHIGRIDAFKVINDYLYPPAYYYLIDVMTLFRFIPKEIAIKLISLFFDYFAAFGIFKILELNFSKSNIKWVGFFAFLFTPTIFIESSMWGQNDIVYAAFLIWSFYFILRNKYALAILFFSISFCFKLQSVFFAPIFLILLLRKKIPFWNFFLIPITYIISILPATLSGGSFVKLLTFYFSQAGFFPGLTLRAPNIYTFIPVDPFYDIKVKIGIIFTCLLVLVYILIRWRKWKDLSNTSLCFDALLFTFFIPYFLPKMHERYFFLAGIFIILLAFFDHEYIWAAILLQITSNISYIPYFSGWSDIFVIISAILNIFLIIGLILVFKKYLKNIQIIHSTE